MKEFIALEKTRDGLHLEVDIGQFCNYKCSYCSCWKTPSRYDWLKLEDLKKLIELKKPTLFSICGGEPTLYPDLIPLLKFAKSRGAVTTLVTNGNKSPDWWKENHKLIDRLTFSFHIEMAIPEIFIRKILAICDERYVTVNLPTLPELFDVCLMVGKDIVQYCKNTRVFIKVVTNKKTGTIFEYTKEQLEIMKTSLCSEIIEIKGTETANYTYKVYSDGSREEIGAHQFLPTDSNHFKNWKCWKGIDVLKVRYSGEIFSAACELKDRAEGKQVKVIGNINDLDNAKFPTDPPICQNEGCYCLMDLAHIRKEKIS